MSEIQLDEAGLQRRIEQLKAADPSRVQLRGQVKGLKAKLARITFDGAKAATERNALAEAVKVSRDHLSNGEPGQAFAALETEPVRAALSHPPAFVPGVPKQALEDSR